MLELESRFFFSFFAVTVLFFFFIFFLSLCFYTCFLPLSALLPLRLWRSLLRDLERSLEEESDELEVELRRDLLLLLFFAFLIPANRSAFIALSVSSSVFGLSSSETTARRADEELQVTFAGAGLVTGLASQGS